LHLAQLDLAKRPVVNEIACAELLFGHRVCNRPVPGRFGIRQPLQQVVDTLAQPCQLLNPAEVADRSAHVRDANRARLPFGERFTPASDAGTHVPSSEEVS